MTRIRLYAMGASAAFLAMMMVCLAATDAVAQGWPEWGGPLIGNQRQAIAETIISPDTAPKLHEKWRFTAAGNIGATPTIEGDRLFFADDGSAGQANVYALNAITGKQIWARPMSSYTGLQGSKSRSSPAVAGQLIIVTDRVSGNVLGLNKTTGALVWTKTIETNPYVVLTASPVVYNGIVYVGTASSEEYWVSVLPNYAPTFRGSLTALDAATGRIEWQTSMVPSGYTGGAIWGSGFAVLPSLNLIYAATGNNYTLPANVTQCVAVATTRAERIACLAKTDYVDSVVAMDLTTGAVRWARRLQGLDTFNLNCNDGPSPVQPCPVPAGKDYDFASAPNLLSVGTGATATTLIGAGQKSGYYWALKPDTGALAWFNHPGPGGGRGGIMWGSAVDATQVYVAENDADGLPYMLAGGTAKIKGGSWAALDSATGRVKWQTPAPESVPGKPGIVSGAEGAMSVANGVVFGGAKDGTMVAMDAATGAILWSFQAGASVTCGPAIVNGMVYWGSGDPYGTNGNTLYAFATR